MMNWTMTSSKSYRNTSQDLNQFMAMPCLASVRDTVQDVFNDATSQRKDERTLVDAARPKWLKDNLKCDKRSNNNFLRGSGRPFAT